MSKNFKVFAKQAGIKASDVNNYLMEQAVVQVSTTADLDIILVRAGVRVAYCTANSTFYYWNGTTWKAQLTEAGLNSGMGYPASTYLMNDFQGAATTAVMAAGTYFIPIRVEAITQIKNLEIYCATYVGGLNQALHVQFYSSQNGRPKTPIGNDVALLSVTAVGYFGGFAGPTYILKPGLYFAAVAFTGTLRSHTYAAVTQSTTSGGPNYLGWTTSSDIPDLQSKPRPGFFTATQYGASGGLTAWATSPAVASVATAPVVRMMCNYLYTPSNLESGLYA